MLNAKTCIKHGFDVLNIGRHIGFIILFSFRHFALVIVLFKSKISMSNLAILCQCVHIASILIKITAVWWWEPGDPLHRIMPSIDPSFLLRDLRYGDTIKTSVQPTRPRASSNICLVL